MQSKADAATARVRLKMIQSKSLRDAVWRVARTAGSAEEAGRQISCLIDESDYVDWDKIGSEVLDEIDEVNAYMRGYANWCK